MKYLLAVSAVFAVLVCSNAQAASLRLEYMSDVYSIYLDGESENGQFDTIIFSITPLGGGSFSNPQGQSADPAGTASTFINAFIGAPTAFGGLGYSVLGDSVSANGLEFTTGPLGGTIDTVNDQNVGPNGLFLANVFVAECCFIAEAKLVSAGNVVQAPTAYTFPEPTSLMLAGLGLLGFVGVRRR